MGYGDVRAHESRVRTRITDSGLGREQLLLYGELSRGCDGDRGQVSIPDADMGTDAQDTGWE